MPEMTEVLIKTPIPPELRKRMSAQYTLVEIPGKDAPALENPERFRACATTAINGFSDAEMAPYPNLGILVSIGTGLEKLDLDAARRRGIAVVNTPDAVTIDTADTAIGLIFAVGRRTVEYDRFVRAGRWGKEIASPSRRVTGKSVGIVGLGKIGAEVAKRAAGLGLAVSYYGPRKKDGVPYRYFDKVGDLAEAVDFLILTCPGGEATRNIVNAEVLKRLGPDGVLINIARGTVVDEEALIEALRNKTIRGAGLDVFLTEPNLNPAFLPLENVVLLPHFAAVTTETREDMANILTTAVEDFLAGRPVADATKR